MATPSTKPAVSTNPPGIKNPSTLPKGTILPNKPELIPPAPAGGDHKAK